MNVRGFYEQSTHCHLICCKICSNILLLHQCCFRSWSLAFCCDFFLAIAYRIVQVLLLLLQLPFRYELKFIRLKLFVYLVNASMQIQNMYECAYFLLCSGSFSIKRVKLKTPDAGTSAHWSMANVYQHLQLAESKLNTHDYYKPEKCTNEQSY